MAALTAAVSVNGSTVAAAAAPHRTSAIGMIRGEAPITLGKGLKMCMVSVNFDGGDYAAAGVDIDLLGSLPGWTAILASTRGHFLDGATAKMAQYNPSTDKVVVHVQTSGAEHAAAALDGEVNLLVFGY